MSSIGYATSGQVAGASFQDSPRNWTLLAAQARQSERTVEVFNLGGFIDYLGTTNDLAIRDHIREVQGIILQTLVRLRNDGPDRPMPEFQFHRGTDLLIVIGDATLHVNRAADESLNSLTGLLDESLAELDPLDRQIMEGKYLQV